MSASSKLLEFFRKEFEAEERNGFARLARIPDSRVGAYHTYFQTWTAIDRLAMIDFCAHWAHKCYSFVIGVPPIVSSDSSLTLRLENGPYFTVWNGASELPQPWLDWSDGQMFTRNRHTHSPRRRKRACSQTHGSNPFGHGSRSQNH